MDRITACCDAARQQLASASWPGEALAASVAVLITVEPLDQYLR